MINEYSCDFVSLEAYKIEYQWKKISYIIPLQMKLRRR